MGQRKRPDEPKAISRSVSLTEELIAAIEEQAAVEGHRNFSAVIVRAVREYLLRFTTGKKVA